MPKVLIVADDLTGANDSAVQFAARGFKAATLLTDGDGFVGGLLSDLDDVEVLAISTESRNVSAATAVGRIERLVPLVLAGFKPDVTFKKIDSTLRGNAGAEVEAVADILARRKRAGEKVAVVVAPAYPSNGRTVRGGYLLVDGKPLSETYAAHDVLAPVQSSYVPDYFGSLAARDYLSLRVADASDQSDLVSLVASYPSPARGSILWVGSAGLANALALSLSPSPDALSLPPGASDEQAVAPDPREGGGRTLVLFGSLNPAAIAQVEALSDMDGCRVILPESTTGLPKALAGAVEAPEKAVVIASHRLKHCANNSSTADRSHLVKAFFGEVAERAVQGRAFDNLVISGGDVAFAVLGKLGASAISIRQEILPGVAFGSVIGGQAAGMGIVTKAGGFGDAGALKRILTFLDR